MIAVLILGTGDDLVTSSLVSSVASGWVMMVLLPVGSAIGSNLLAVVNWRMGTEAPLSGVIPTGGSDGPGLL